MPHSTTISSSPYQVDPWVALNRDQLKSDQRTLAIKPRGKRLGQIAKGGVTKHRLQRVGFYRYTDKQPGDAHRRRIQGTKTISMSRKIGALLWIFSRERAKFLAQ